MDLRWLPASINSRKDTQVYLHPTNDMRDVARGVSNDAVDLSPFVTAATQSQNQINLSFTFNGELLGAGQPRYGQVIEIVADGIRLWVGIVQEISISAGFAERRMTLVARSRETMDVWKLSKRVTESYGPGVSFNKIISDVALVGGLAADEIDVPDSVYVTAHPNTQLSGLTIWEMLTQLMLPLGLTPYMNWAGKLKGANRSLKDRQPDILVPEERLINLGGSRSRPPTTRYILQWLDPKLTRSTKQAQKLAEVTITSGWWIPYIYKSIWFSDDRSQRAENTYMITKQSANALFVPVCDESYEQQTESEGRVTIFSYGYSQTLLVLAEVIKLAAHGTPEPVVGGGIFAFFGVTIPVGRLLEFAADLAIFLVQIAQGTGIYEIWGSPYDVIHALNTTEAYDSAAAPWLDNPQDARCDFITNENHAQEVAVRELIFLSSQASSWKATIVDDRRVEVGDILQFPDGSKMYVTDYNRNIFRGSENILSVEGFSVWAAPAS